METEKEKIIQCVPTELLGRLRGLAERLWEDKSPASVHLTAILEEFEPEVRSLSHIVKEFESVGSQREQRWKKAAEETAAKLAAAEKELAEAKKTIDEIRTRAFSREETISEMQVQSVKARGEFSSQYAARMTELYEAVGKKERELVEQWQAKTKALDAEFRSRKAELVNSLEAMRMELKKKEMALDGEYAAKFATLEGRRRDLEADFEARKEDQLRTFEKIKSGLEAREKALERREKGGGDDQI